MHTKPRQLYNHECHECHKPFEAFSKAARFCIICREIVRARNRAKRREVNRAKLVEDKGRKKGIDPKWLVRGTPSDSGNTDGISNGSF